MEPGISLPYSQATATRSEAIKQNQGRVSLPENPIVLILDVMLHVENFDILAKL